MRIVFPSLLILLLWSCGNEKPAPAATDGAAALPAPVQTPAAARQTDSPLLGSYVGFFQAKVYDTDQNITWSNKITVFLDSVQGEQLFGHSVVAGNVRPFSGTLRREGGQYVAAVREPGDDQYDGVFSMTIGADGQMIKGTWQAYKKLGVSERQYELKRRRFQYDPGLDLPEDAGWADLYNTYDERTGKAEFLTLDVTRYNASARLLKKEEVENLYKADLEVIRNAIYARHGYSFKNRRMRYVFDGYVDWYMPVSVDIRGELTDIEKQNIELLKRYEQHAERYYDQYGR